MKTYSALYYPYLTVQNEGLLKHALLFWDQLDVIDPFSRTCRLPRNEELHDAAKLILEPYNPNDEEKERAHGQIIELLDRDLPQWFFPADSSRPELRESIYTKKFLYKTWDELQRRKLIRRFQNDHPAVETSTVLGHLMMAILADCCASYTRATVTDEPFCYGNVFKALAVETKAQRPPPELFNRESNSRALIVAPVLTPLLDSIPLDSLVRLRVREGRTTGHHYTALRHSFYDRLVEWSEGLVNLSLRESDQKELLNEYKRALDRDFSALREELGIAGRGFVLSKEMGALAVGVTSAFLTGGWTSPALAVSSGAVLATMHDKYRSARLKALYGHFSSYLYLAKKGRFELDAF